MLIFQHVQISKIFKSDTSPNLAVIKKANLFSDPRTRKINPSWFTNKVRMSDISGVIGSKEQHIYHVFFEHGAKTKIHVHNGNQILIVTKGRGVLETFAKTQHKKDNFGIKRTKKIALNPGDVVHIARGTLHTHGSADKNRLFSHIAINVIPAKNKEYRTVWYESDFKSRAGNIIK